MSEQSFFDTERQLIVRLGDETLAYVPVDQPGWQCRLDDIAWTTSRMTPRGVHEVKLHAADGRVVASLAEFEQIERFYLTLVRQLACRPFFDAVRESMPTQVGSLERLLWLAAQTRARDECWEALHIEEDAAAAATPGGLLLMTSRDLSAEWVPWTDLAAVRTRSPSPYVDRGVLRLFGPAIYRDLSFSEPPPRFIEACDRHRRRLLSEGAAVPTFRIPGVECDHQETLLRFAPELEAARNDGLLAPTETVVACAWGGSGGTTLPGTEGEVIPQSRPATATNRPASGPVTELKTDLVLTNRRLIQADRYRDGHHVVAQLDLGGSHLPVMRRIGTVIQVGQFELHTDMAQPFEMAREFFDCYRGLFTQVLDPFAPDAEIAAPAPGRSAAAARIPDPFAPEIEAPPAPPPGTGPWRP